MMAEDLQVQLESLSGQLKAVDLKLDLQSKSILDQIGFTDRNAQQLVQLVKERLETVQKDVERVAAVQREHHDSNAKRFENIEGRLTDLEALKNRLLGIAAAASVGTGVVTGIVLKLI